MLYKDINQLRRKADKYLKESVIVAPRSFRLYLGVSKHLLSTWKKTKPEYFNLIKTYEDMILAKIEEYAIYGALHPDLQGVHTSVTTDKDGNVIKEETKFNQVGAIFTLRAYDRNTYVPEIAQENARQLTDSDGAKLIEIITPKAKAEKGVQSVRPIEITDK